jgi:hypothetical protein
LTQLVGVICDDGNTVITVSDRMVSTGDMTLSYDRPRFKGVKISDNAVIMTAGTVHEPELLRVVCGKAGRMDKIQDIVEEVVEVYHQIREKYIINEVLRSIGIKSFSEWHDLQKKLHDGIVMRIDREITEYDLGLHLLLAGFDGEGHLIRVGNPGTFSSYDNLSYCCVGIGNRHADTIFAYHKYSRSFSRNEAIYISFEAKKRAELAGGVGESTDILIIDKNGIVSLDNKTIEELKAIYDERENGIGRTTFNKNITELEIKTNPLAI